MTIRSVFSSHRARSPETSFSLFSICVVLLCTFVSTAHVFAQQTEPDAVAESSQENEQETNSEEKPNSDSVEKKDETDSPVIELDPNLPDVIAKYAPRAIKKWESDIVKLEDKNQQEQYPEDAILFIGSSSIRRWDSIAEDIAPYIPIQRGYGGARYSDLAYFADRLITPHQYQAVVMFVANDVQNQKGDADTDLDDIDGLVRHIVSVSAKHAPGKPFFIIEVTPTQSRQSIWDKTKRLNAILREVCFSTPDTFFIETAETFLTDDKQPIERLFVEDRLHLNADGYDLWASLIKSELKYFLERHKANE
jgi:lysophospholipase L1-like esterase